jgi:signal transduction histidine kinase
MGWMLNCLRFASVLAFGLCVGLALALQTSQSRAQATIWSLGGSADHFLDLAGTATVDELAAAAGGQRFRPANGTVANYGPRPVPTARLWLRFKIPEVLREQAGGLILVHDELRVRRATLYLPNPSGFTPKVWDGEAHGLPDVTMTRFPAWQLDPASVAGQTLYVSIETNSSMRGFLSLEPFAVFAHRYGGESFFFGTSVGIVTMMALFLLVAGALNRDRSSLFLALFGLAYVVYVVAHQAFLELHVWPCALGLSRAVSLSAVLFIFAFRLFYIDEFLRLGVYSRWMSRVLQVSAWVLIVMALVLAVEASFPGLIGLRRYTAYAGLISFAIGTLAALYVATRNIRRFLVYAVCWGPVSISGILRVLHDAVPAIGIIPLGLNLTYVLTTFAFALSGIIAGIEIYQRERDRRVALEVSQERLRDFALNSSDSFWEAAPNGDVRFASGPLMAAAGGAPVSNVLDSWGGASPTLETSLGGTTAFQLDLEQSGSSLADHRVLDVRARPRLSPDGRVEVWRGTVSDVTMERRKDIEERERQKHAAIGQLASGVAHEINNLLHPIINLTRRSMDGLDPKDVRRTWLSTVINSGSRAAEIVSTLLRKARSAGNEKLNIPMANALERAFEEIRSVAPRSVTLSLKRLDHGGPLLPETEVFQVVANLTSNAIFAVRDGGTVDVAFERSEEDPHQFVLSVSDNGPGMDQEAQMRAREPFYTTKPIGEGTGLGLFLVDRLVQSWGGTLALNSSPGVGTRVSIHVSDHGADKR